MAVVVYQKKRQSCVDIIPECDFYREMDDEGMEFGFFDLPYMIQVEIASLLSLDDTRALAATCRAGWTMSKDQFLWRRRLWTRAKVVNLSLSTFPAETLPYANMLIKDPLFVDNRLLYEILDPEEVEIRGKEKLDIQNLLSKVLEPSGKSGNYSFTILNLSERFEGLLRSLRGEVITSHPILADPFSKGQGAPTFLLFGPPETRPSKKLALSLIASKDDTFETIGLVKGKPGGVGGGVTIRYRDHIVNILPIRRARPRLLILQPEGTVFHPDVAEVVSRVDGLICYMDATCWCSEKQFDPANRTFSKDFFSNSTIREGIYEYGDHRIDILELEAILRTISPTSAPPILVLLAHMDENQPPFGSQDSDSDDGVQSKYSRQCIVNRHRPMLYFSVMKCLDLPWAVCEVEANSLLGIHGGLNWLIKRTQKLKVS